MRGKTMSRAEISDVQQKLEADNLYHRKIDGKLGPETRRALAKYQRQNGLRVTANLDRQTKDSELGNTGTANPPSSTAHTMPTPSQGGAGASPPAQGSANAGTAPSGATSATAR
jgi:peptidoglycan hydrolase-like protein with peptidoglycan-binding domain